jgi:hypothetical protein
LNGHPAITYGAAMVTVGIPLAGLLLVGAAGAVAATTDEPAAEPAVTVAAP